MVLRGDVLQDGTASKHDDGHHLQIGPGTKGSLYRVGVGNRLLHWVVETVLCDVGIGLVPFLHVGDIGDDDLCPLLAIVVAVDVATVVFGLDGEDSVTRHHDMIYLSGAAIGLQDHIIQNGVIWRQLGKGVVDVKLALFAFVLRGVPDCSPNNKGNDQYYENDAYNHYLRLHL